MQFYQTCLGGELHLQRVGDTPESENLPGHMKECILQATLKSESMILMGTDMVADEGLIQGNTISVLFLCNSETGLRKMYRKLVVDGQATQPVRGRSGGGLFGGLTDKYGNHWLLRYEEHAEISKTLSSGWFTFQEN